MEFEELNNLENKKFVIFNGKKYCRMGGKRIYFLSYESRNALRKNPKGLHVAVWEYVNKREVPKGYVVHHKDHNPFNNQPDNLECLSLREHLELHKEDRERYFKSAESLEHLNKIRHLANDWHKSEEGREWHKKHAKEILENKKEKRICQDCGCEFDIYNLPKRKSDVFDGRWCKKCYGKHWQRLYRKLQRGEITRLQFESGWRSIFCK